MLGLFRLIQNQLVVNLIGKDDQVVASRQLRQLFQHSARADCAGRIIGIDQNDGASAPVDLMLNVDQIRLPAVVFVQVVRSDRNAKFAQHRRIQGIIRTGSQNVLAGIDQGSKRYVYGFAGARSHERILDRGNAFACRLAANRLQRFRNAGRRGIAILALPHCFIDGLDQMRRSLEIKNVGITDVERQDLVALTSDLVGNRRQVADGVADVVETLGGGDLADLRAGHGAPSKVKLLTAKVKKLPQRAQRNSLLGDLCATDN